MCPAHPARNGGRATRPPHLETEMKNALYMDRYGIAHHAEVVELNEETRVANLRQMTWTGWLALEAVPHVEEDRPLSHTWVEADALSEDDT